MNSFNGEATTEPKTVFDILGIEPGNAAQAPPNRVVLRVLEGVPPLPAPGIYFGMPDEVYHALPALSNSGVKKLAASPMMFWADTAWLCERKKREVEENAGEEKVHHVFGKAYHCRLMEGVDEFERRYAVELDPADYPEALEKTAQIKAAIERHTQRQPVKPRGRSKDELEAQLRGLIQLHGRDPVPEGLKPTVDVLKAAIGEFEEDAPVKPASKVADFMPDGGEEYMRDAVKADWIAQLLALDPEAQIFDVISAKHRQANEGKAFLSPDQHDELAIAAAMVERDPEIKNAFKGGHAEVTLIWYCPKTGVPMKARVDYLKIKMMVDLKSIGNQRQRSMEQAIRFEIASWHYNIQPSVYFEGAAEVRKLVREHGVSAIHCTDEAAAPEQTAFALKWAQHSKPDEWLWIFQQKGRAPITRGVWYPRGTVKMVTDDIVLAAKRKFREFAEAFGTDPWIDVAPTYTIDDESIPLSATEI